MNKIQIAIMAGAISIAVQAQAALVANGGFDNTGGTFVPNGQGYMMVNNGDSTTIPGWTVQNQNIAWESHATTLGGTILGTPTPYWLDISGEHDAIPYGGVVGTTISTVSGAWYTLSFEVGKGLNQSPNPAVIYAMAGSQSGTFTDSDADPGGLNTVWRTFSLQFQATSPSTTITLQGTDANSGNAFVGLANVNVSAVPEPTTMISGLGALGLLLFGAGVHSKRSVLRIGK
jgi:hypothetical protein